MISIGLLKRTLKSSFTISLVLAAFGALPTAATAAPPPIKEFKLTSPSPSPTVSDPGRGDTRLPNGIAAGPDGSLWFVEFNNNAIGRITTAGVVTEYPLPDDQFKGGSQPNGIIVGPDGNLWFTEFNGHKIG